MFDGLSAPKCCRSRLGCLSLQLSFNACSTVFPGGPGVHHSLGKLLGEVSQKLERRYRTEIPNLQLVHRLDKETTGVMVLAK